MMLKMSQKTRQTTSTLTIDGIAWISAFTTTCRYHSNHHISSTFWGFGWQRRAAINYYYYYYYYYNYYFRSAASSPDNLV